MISNELIKSPTDLRWKKKGAGVSTLYPANTGIQEMEELASEAFARANVSATTWSSTVLFRGSNVSFGGFAENVSGSWFPKSAYITSIP